MIWDFQQCGMYDQQRLRPACAYAQSDQSLCWLLEYFMTVNLLTEHHLEFLSLKGGCTGSSESTLVKIPHCWKSHVTAHISLLWLAETSFHFHDQWQVDIRMCQCCQTMCKFLVEKYILIIFAYELFRVEWKIVNTTRYIYIWVKVLLYCGQIIVVHVHANGFL